MPVRYVTNCRHCEKPFMSEANHQPKWCSNTCRNYGKQAIRRQEYIRRGLMRPRHPWL